MLGPLPTTVFLDESATIEKTILPAPESNDPAPVRRAALHSCDFEAVGGAWTYQWKFGDTLQGAARTLADTESLRINKGEQFISPPAGQDLILGLTRIGGSIVGHATGVQVEG